MWLSYGLMDGPIEEIKPTNIGVKAAMIRAESTQMRSTKSTEMKM